MNVSTGCHSKAALQAGGEVGDDVAEHVIGDDHIELARIANHLCAECVHVHVLGLDLRIFCAQFFKKPLS